MDVLTLYTKDGLPISIPASLMMARTKLKAFSHYAGRYIAEVLPERHSPKNREMVERQIRYWMDRFDGKSIDEVTRDDVVSGRSALLASGRSNSTCNRYVHALSGLFTVAIDDWELELNHVVRRVKRLREPAGRVRYLKSNERDVLLFECRNSRSPYLFCAVLLSICTGLRRGELRRLEWGDVDTKSRVIAITRTKVGNAGLLPIPDVCVRELEILYELARMRPGQRCKRSVFPYDFREAWENAKTRANLKDFRWHDLRHSFATFAASRGAAGPQVQHVLGHSCSQMTARYMNLDAEHLRGMIDNVAEVLFEE